MPYRNSATSDALAQHRDRDHDRHGDQRTLPQRDVAPQRLHLARHLPPMARHPDLVPAQHDGRQDQDRGGEHLLPGARRTRRTARRRRPPAPQRRPRRQRRRRRSNRPRRATPSVAASTMPTIRPASNTSRKTMIRVASTATSPPRLRPRPRCPSRRGGSRRRTYRCPGFSGPAMTLIFPPGTTIFSTRRSVLSNSAGVEPDSGPRCGTARRREP